MIMENQILKEIKEMKIVLAKVIGTSELPVKERFSTDAINKASKEFLKLSIERGVWVEEGHIEKYIKYAGWRSGAFIRNELKFTNYFKRGHSYYYYKDDLIRLDKELKKRNIQLKRYIELKEDEEKFRKYVASAAENKKGKFNNKPYVMPDGLKDITTSAPPAPDPEMIREDIKNLKEEFFQYKLAEYIDIYNDNHAMTKFLYHFDRYLNSEIKKRAKKWCENFNYANEALQLLTKKKEKFIPVKDEDMYQL